MKIPAWWTRCFGVMLGVAFLYLFIHLVAYDQLSAVASYDRDVLDDIKQQGGLLTPDTPTITRLMKDADSLAAGAALFSANCVACHGQQASGLIGPNLTDDYYLNVKSLIDIPDVISKGRKNGLMPAWSPRLSQNQITLLSAYVASLRGKNIPGPRPAEGQKISPW